MEIEIIKEQIRMDILTEKLGNNGKITDDKLKEILDKYGEVQTDEEWEITGVKTDKGGYDIPIEDILNGEEITPSTPEEPEKPNEDKITAITLNRHTLELEEGNNETLIITIKSENIENKEVEWTSNNTEVATVNAKGEVTAIKEGTKANYVLPENDRKATDGTYKPLSQANKGVWDYIRRADAITVSKAMIDYNETGVHSTIISGAAWDTTLQWITHTVDATYAENSTDKGNYSGAIRTTGSNTAYSKNNIYDMAGNAEEWTTEACSLLGVSGFNFRGRNDTWHK